MRVVLSIAGFDPSGGAGVLADIKTFSAFGCFGTAAITSLTSQNTVAVYGTVHQSADTLRAQIEPVINDFQIAAVKTGMLPTRETIEVTAEMIEQHRLPNVVVDPVIRSTSGFDLIDEAAMKFLIERLLPLAKVITPNMAEAERLTGFEVKDLNGMKRAAERIYELAQLKVRNHGVLVKGGHLPSEATDVLFDGEQFQLFRSAKIATRNTHGTGCTLSSAIAALLAGGCEPAEAITKAKGYLESALLSAPNLGHGAGPLNHLVGGFEIIG
ncbi:MAG: bifunctional hydroxymethylpyrimidine kinase/phosphomethylpyrimidine kinase [Acidobacteriota bacterium]|nr:bifunctional hydroxymethylpyrimidine kinase/phosphomethylpyrimidine kinase [Acidobacteriota bacterium]